MKKFIFGTLIKVIEITLLVVIADFLQDVIAHTCCGMDNNIKIVLNVMQWLNVCLIIEIILDTFVWSVVRNYKLNKKEGETK